MHTLHSLFALLFLFSVVAAGNVRFAHLALGGADVAVYVSLNGALTFSKVQFQTVTDYASVAAGNVAVTVADAQNQTIANLTVTVGDTTYTTVAAVGQKTVNLTSYADQFSKPDISNLKTQLRFIHTIDNGPIVNISLGTANITISKLGFPNATNYLTLDEGAISATAVDAVTNTTVASQLLFLFKGVCFTAFLENDKDGKAIIKLSTDYDYRQSRVRATHASPDAPAVDIKVDTVTFNALTYGQESAYQDVVPGTRSVIVTANRTVVYNNTANFTPLSAYTVLVYGFAKPPGNNTNRLTVVVLSDPVPQPDQSVVRFANLVPDAPAFLIVMTAYNFTLPYGAENANVVRLAPGTYEVSIYPVAGYTKRRASRRYTVGATPLSTSNITLTANSVYSAYVEGSGGNIRLSIDNQPTPTPNNDSGGLSSGAIAGIVIGSIFGALLIFGILIYFYKRTRYQSIP